MGLECDGEGRVTVLLRGGGYLRYLKLTQLDHLAQHCCVRSLSLREIEYVERFGGRVDWFDWSPGLVKLVQDGRKAHAGMIAHERRRALAAALVRAVAAAASMKAAFA
jgi:hypothetical protein